MAQTLAGKSRFSLRAHSTLTHALIFGSALLFAPALFASAAHAQALSYASTPQESFPSDNVMVTPSNEADSDAALPDRYRRTIVAFDTREAPGTVIIDTSNTALYYVLGQNRAIRYGVGVGREGFTWAGTQTITRKAEWPDWHPPAEMIARQPYLPRFMAGGPGNPLGARAMYLGSSEYRIHGTNDPSTIGKFVSSGCIRLTNEDVSDLFSRVQVGAKVIVLPKNTHYQARAAATARVVAPAHTAAIAARPAAVSVSTSTRPAVTTLSSGRQAMNIPVGSSTSSLY